MLEILTKRKEIRELINNYPQNQWENIIQLIIEIGISYLHSTYPKVNFTVEDLRTIIQELKLKQRDHGINMILNYS